jgi:plasmid stabilization system protein ParE
LKPVRVLHQAEAEADKAFDWYEGQSESAASGFAAELRDAFLKIRKNPKLYPAYLHGTQHRILNRYPFSVVYRELLDVIQIIAVAHAKRRPGYWKKRI